MLKWVVFVHVQSLRTSNGKFHNCVLNISLFIRTSCVFSSLYTNELCRCIIGEFLPLRHPWILSSWILYFLYFIFLLKKHSYIWEIENSYTYKHLCSRVHCTASRDSNARSKLTTFFYIGVNRSIYLLLVRLLYMYTVTCGKD